MSDVKCERFNNVAPLPAKKNVAPLICKSYGDKNELNYIENEEQRAFWLILPNELILPK